MQNRVKRLRMHFGLDQGALAEWLGRSVPEVQAWESGEPLSAEDLALFEGRTGVASAWLTGNDVPLVGARLTELKQKVSREIARLSGPRLIRMVMATTGERIAEAVNRMRQLAPDLCTVECMACWLGLAPESAKMLLQGRLDPGTPVVARASDLTGLPERWFRQGPET